MLLVMFDLDGTLLNTYQVDGDCYVRALELECGIALADQDWSRFETVTDAGVFREVFVKTFGRAPEPKEVQAFIDRFMDLLREAYDHAPERFEEVPGASNLLNRLGTSDGLRVGLATGGWLASALFKLQCAGISPENLPLSTAEDGDSRESILRACQARAGTVYRVARFDRIVSVGDQVWDIKAARTLNLPFIGVGDPEKLRGWGASQAVPDFRDPDGFIDLLDLARVPARD
jgi:phosphoglycolate phosphatase-like HAD superfamily hydrolase